MPLRLNMMAWSLSTHATRIWGLLYLAKMAGEYPGWNFHKYLIGPDGKMLASFKSHITPNDPAVISMIERHLPAVLADE